MLFHKASKPANVFGSMLLDELLFAPLLYMSFFPAYQIVQDRDLMSLGKGIDVCKEKIWETIINSWKIWPACSIINFWFVPVKYQSLFVSMTSFFWSMILSYIASKWLYTILYSFIKNTVIERNKEYIGDIQETPSNKLA